MRRTYVVGLGLGTALLFGAFQNCGKLGFSTGSSTSGGPTAGTLGIAAASLGNFACGSYQEVGRNADGTLASVPARGDDGACYFVKVIDAVADASAAVPETDLAAAAGVRRLAAGSATFTLLGERAVELSNSVTLPAPVSVADLLITGLYAAGTIPDVASDFDVHGNAACAQASADATIALGGSPLAITPIEDIFAVGAAVEPNVPYTLDVRAETCGMTGHVSDVFVIFR